MRLREDAVSVLDKERTALLQSLASVHSLRDNVLSGEVNRHLVRARELEDAARKAATVPLEDKVAEVAALRSGQLPGKGMDDFESPLKALSSPDPEERRRAFMMLAHASLKSPSQSRASAAAAAVAAAAAGTAAGAGPEFGSPSGRRSVSRSRLASPAPTLAPSRAFGSPSRASSRGSKPGGDVATPSTVASRRGVVPRTSSSRKDPAAGVAAAVAAAAKRARSPPRAERAGGMRDRARQASAAIDDAADPAPAAVPAPLSAAAAAAAMTAAAAAAGRPRASFDAQAAPSLAPPSTAASAAFGTAAQAADVEAAGPAVGARRASTIAGRPSGYHSRQARVRPAQAIAAPAAAAAPEGGVSFVQYGGESLPPALAAQLSPPAAASVSGTGARAEAASSSGDGVELPSSTQAAHMDRLNSTALSDLWWGMAGLGAEDPRAAQLLGGVPTSAAQTALLAPGSGAGAGAALGAAGAGGDHRTRLIGAPMIPAGDEGHDGEALAAVLKSAAMAAAAAAKFTGGQQGAASAAGAAMPFPDPFAAPVPGAVTARPEQPWERMDRVGVPGSDEPLGWQGSHAAAAHAASSLGTAAEAVTAAYSAVMGKTVPMPGEHASYVDSFYPPPSQTIPYRPIDLPVHGAGAVGCAVPRSLHSSYPQAGYSYDGDDDLEYPRVHVARASASGPWGNDDDLVMAAQQALSGEPLHGVMHGAEAGAGSLHDAWGPSSQAAPGVGTSPSLPAGGAAGAPGPGAGVGWVAGGSGAEAGDESHGAALMGPVPAYVPAGVASLMREFVSKEAVTTGRAPTALVSFLHAVNAMWHQRLEQACEHVALKHQAEVQMWRRRFANGIPSSEIVRQQNGLKSGVKHPGSRARGSTPARAGQTCCVAHSIVPPNVRAMDHSCCRTGKTGPNHCSNSAGGAGGVGEDSASPVGCSAYSQYPACPACVTAGKLAGVAGSGPTAGAASRPGRATAGLGPSLASRPYLSARSATLPFSRPLPSDGSPASRSSALARPDPTGGRVTLTHGTSGDQAAALAGAVSAAAAAGKDDAVDNVSAFAAQRGRRGDHEAGAAGSSSSSRVRAVSAPPGVLDAGSPSGPNHRRAEGGAEGAGGDQAGRRIAIAEPERAPRPWDQPPAGARASNNNSSNKGGKQAPAAATPGPLGDQFNEAALEAALSTVQELSRKCLRLQDETDAAKLKVGPDDEKSLYAWLCLLLVLSSRKRLLPFPLFLPRPRTWTRRSSVCGRRTSPRTSPCGVE